MYGTKGSIVVVHNSNKEWRLGRVQELYTLERREGLTKGCAYDSIITK